MIELDIVEIEIKEKLLDAISYIENEAQNQDLPLLEVEASAVRLTIEDLRGMKKEDIENLINQHRLRIIEAIGRDIAHNLARLLNKIEDLNTHLKEEEIDVIRDCTSQLEYTLSGVFQEILGISDMWHISSS